MRRVYITITRIHIRLITEHTGRRDLVLTTLCGILDHNYLTAIEHAINEKYI